MRLLILSDLHLESMPFPDAFRPALPDFDVLVSAGDIWSANVGRGFEILRKIAGSRRVVAVLGNHEHFRGEINATMATARRAATATGILLLEGDAVDLDGVRFIGATLWSDYKLAGTIDDASPTGEDIRVCGENLELPFTVGAARQLHFAARKRLAHLINKESPLPRVVLTHHAPLPDCVAPADNGQWIAGNSASDLSNLTDTGRVELWVHGHIHRSIDMRRPAGTRILCNAAGTLFSNPRFDEHLVVEIKR